MKYFNTSRTILWLMVLLSSLSTYAQNSMVGDGFGGRPGYTPVNYMPSNQAMYAVCDANRQLYAWGNNYYAMGTGVSYPTLSGSNTPLAVSGMTNVQYVSGGSQYKSAIKLDGTAWQWGQGGYGIASMWSPVQVLTNVYYSNGGNGRIGYVKTDGTVWFSVGKNSFGEFGNGTTTGCSTSSTCVIQMLDITAAKRVSCGSYTSTVLLADGTVKTAGGVGQATYVPDALISNVPITVPGLNNIVDIKSNPFSSLALTSTGQVYSWGKGIYLGRGFSAASAAQMPGLITFPAGAAPIKAIIASVSTSGLFAIDDNNNLYAWGDNLNGNVMGNGTSGNTFSTPQFVMANVKDVIASENVTYLVKTDGTMWGAGIAQTSGQSLWMNVSNTNHYTWTQINPTIAPMNLCAPTDFNGMPPCVAGTTAPAVTPTTATNSCPTTTVNLGSLAVSSTTPSGASLIWSTNKVPTSAADTLTTAQKTAVSTAGTYYALYYDATNACYSPADSVVVTMTTCAPITVTNTCPTATVNLMTAISPTNLPSGATVTWHNGTPATAANQVTDPTAISTSGTYYMAYYDGLNNCYSDASPPLTVTITPCVTPLTVNNAPAQTATTGAAMTGNAATELAPTGGTSPYIYSNGAGDAACVAPSGATALTGLTVNSNGTYSYTAPATAGTYYYCIKVCDSTTPTAQCVVKTYTLTVTAAASCTISNIMPTFIKN